MLSPRQYSALKEIAVRNNLPVSTYLRALIIDVLLDEEEAQARMAEALPTEIAAPTIS